VPDFVVQLWSVDAEVGTLILEAKGYDPLVSLKYSAVQRWIAAVNAEGSCGRWAYRMARVPTDVPEAVSSAAEELAKA
jgi:hypothetical protein